MPATLGCKDWFSAKVTTIGELDAAMDKVSTTDVASYIEMVADQHDYPAAMQVLHSRTSDLYGL